MVSSLRHALRSLRRSPAFAITVVLTLALGIGLNAAIFTVVDCVLLRPLGYHDANRIVALQTHFTDENRSIPRLGGDDYRDLSQQVNGLEPTAYYAAYPTGISLNGTALYLPTAMVSPRFGEVMGVEPLAGRLFRSDDKDSHDALVSAAFAREHFGSAAAALGQTLYSEQQPSVIVGVLPDGFSFPDKTEVWLEQNATPESAARSAYNQHAIGKRRANVSSSQLAAELDTFSRQLQRAYPEDAHKTIETVPLQEQIVGNIRPTLRLLMGSVGILLLIVCANITHLQLVRATRQLRSITIRTALGASRKVLALRALLEATLLAAAGSIAAVFIAWTALQLLVRLAPPELPRLGDVRMNADVFLFAFVLSLIVMAITALLPVWRSWHAEPAAVLRQDAARGTESRSSVRLRDGLIVAEVALTLTLSVAAILLTRQLIAQSHQDLGFSAAALVTLDTHTVNAAPFPDHPTDHSPKSLAAWTAAVTAIAQSNLSHMNAALDSIAHLPGVLSAGAIDAAPMSTSGGSDVGYAVRGRQTFAPPFANLPNADINSVTPGVLGTMGVPLLHGRMLNINDRLGAPMVLLINQTLARTIFPNQDPIGKQIMCGYDMDRSWWTIVGVVGDIRSDSPATPPAATFYVPIAQHPTRASDIQFVVRTAMPPAAMAETLRRRLVQSHPEIAVKATTMQENIGETQRAENFRSLLFGSFAFVSILLAAIGIYGVTAYSVAQRRFEFGLRFALGAQRAQVLWMVLRDALAVTAIGVCLGVVLSFGLLRLLASVLGKLPTFDLVAYGLAILSVLGIALCATLLPARRASTIEPMAVLRSE
ncbi:MAG: ABC transporter permease [Acidobacteriaceae bacterium]